MTNDEAIKILKGLHYEKVPYWREMQAIKKAVEVLSIYDLPDNLDEASMDFADSTDLSEYRRDAWEFVQKVFRAGVIWYISQIPQLPDDLEEAAKKIAYLACNKLQDGQEKDSIVYYAILAAIGGAKYMAGQGVSMSGKVGVLYGVDVEDFTKELHKADFKPGEEVILQIRKK